MNIKEMNDSFRAGLMLAAHVLPECPIELKESLQKKICVSSFFRGVNIARMLDRCGSNIKCTVAKIE
jgi:hypothetical protein